MLKWCRDLFPIQELGFQRIVIKGWYNINVEGLNVTRYVQQVGTECTVGWFCRKAFNSWKHVRSTFQSYLVLKLARWSSVSSVFVWCVILYLFYNSSTLYLDVLYPALSITRVFQVFKLVQVIFAAPLYPSVIFVRNW